MNLSNKKTAKRISVWTLVFTLALTLVMMSLTLPTQGKNVMDRTGDAISDVGNGIEEAMSDVGDAVSDVGNGIGEASLYKCCYGIVAGRSFASSC